MIGDPGFTKIMYRGKPFLPDVIKKLSRWELLKAFIHGSLTIHMTVDFHKSERKLEIY